MLPKTVFLILAIGFAVFYLGKKAFAPYIDEEQYKLWQRVWLIVNGVSFFTGNFILFLVLAAGTIYHYSKKIDNRAAYFLALSLAFPHFEIATPIFNISYPRILSLVVLLPMLFKKDWKDWRRNVPSIGKPLGDKLLILLMILMFFLHMRGTTLGDSFRTSAALFVDWFLPYFVISRIQSFNELRTALIALTVSCTIISIFAVIEYAVSTVVYYELVFKMGITHGMPAITIRDGHVRAVTTTIHSLVLGMILLEVIGINLSLSSLVKSPWLRRSYFISLLLGLFSTLSRGPWSSTIIAALVYTISGRKAVSKTILLVMTFMLAIMILPSIPGGKKIINMVPFIGKSEQFNVAYRQELIPKSIEIVKRNPFFGVVDPNSQPEMEDMIQGEGIVDIVNTYLNIVLNYGLVGLVIFLWLFLWSINSAFKTLKYIKDKNSLRYNLGRAFCSTVIGLMAALSSISFMNSVGTFVFILLGFCAAYSRIIINEARQGTLNT